MGGRNEREKNIGKKETGFKGMKEGKWRGKSIREHIPHTEGEKKNDTDNTDTQ